MQSSDDYKAGFKAGCRHYREFVAGWLAENGYCQLTDAEHGTLALYHDARPQWVMARALIGLTDVGRLDTEAGRAELQAMLAGCTCDATLAAVRDVLNVLLAGRRGSVDGIDPAPAGTADLDRIEALVRRLKRKAARATRRAAAPRPAARCAA